MLTCYTAEWQRLWIIVLEYTCRLCSNSWNNMQIATPSRQKQADKFRHGCLKGKYNDSMQWFMLACSCIHCVSSMDLCCSSGAVVCSCMLDS